MKVTCEYCGSYVEADENMKCPLCDGALGSAVLSEQKRSEEQQEEAYQREAEEKAREAKEEHISEAIAGIASVATAIAGNVTRSDTPDEHQFPHTRGNRPPEPPDGSRMPPRSHGERHPMGGKDNHRPRPR